MASKRYEREVRAAKKWLAKNPVGPAELEAIAARHAERERLRNLILAHATTRDTPTGPEYVGCHCESCELNRKKMEAIGRG